MAIKMKPFNKREEYYPHVTFFFQLKPFKLSFDIKYGSSSQLIVVWDFTKLQT